MILLSIHKLPFWLNDNESPLVEQTMLILTPEMVEFCLTTQMRLIQPMYSRHCNCKCFINDKAKLTKKYLQNAYCKTFRLLTVLCGKTNLLTTDTGLISFLSGSTSFSSETEMVLPYYSSSQTILDHQFTIAGC